MVGGGVWFFFQHEAFRKRCSNAMFVHKFSKRIQSLWWGGGVYTERTRRTSLIRLQHNVKTKNSKITRASILLKTSSDSRRIRGRFGNTAWREQNLNVFYVWSYWLAVRTIKLFSMQIFKVHLPSDQGNNSGKNKWILLFSLFKGWFMSLYENMWVCC